LRLGIQRSLVQAGLGPRAYAIGTAKAASLAIDVLIFGAQAVRRSKRQTSLGCQRPLQGKSTDDLVCPSRKVATDWLALAERHIPVAGQYECIAAVVVAVSVVSPRIHEKVIGLVGACVRPGVMGEDLEALRVALLEEDL